MVWDFLPQVKFARFFCDCEGKIHLTLVGPGGRSVGAGVGIGSDCFPSSSCIRTSNRSHSVAPERVELLPQSHEWCAGCGQAWWKGVQGWEHSNGPHRQWPSCGFQMSSESSVASLDCRCWCGDEALLKGSSVFVLRLTQVKSGLLSHNVIGWESENKQNLCLAKHKTRIKHSFSRHDGNSPLCVSILSAAPPWSPPFVCIFRFFSLLVIHIDCVASAPCEAWNSKGFVKQQVTLNVE